MTNGGGRGAWAPRDSGEHDVSAVIASAIDRGTLRTRRPAWLLPLDILRNRGDV
jgi:hypothetical protein